MSNGPSLAASLVCAVVAFGSAAAAPAPAASRAPLIALTEIADIESLALSPDGRSVAFRVQRPSVARNTYAIEWYVADLPSGKVTPVGDGGEVIYDNGVIESDPPGLGARRPCVLQTGPGRRRDRNLAHRRGRLGQ